jgi:uncharacterized protein YdgA (DUF945 family)
MKKLIIFVIIIVAIAAAPWYVGLKAQLELESQIDKFANYPGYSVELLEYNRGLLSSTGKLKIAYSIADVPQNDAMEQKFISVLNDGIVLKLNVTHGPLLTKPEFGPGLSYTEVTLDDSQEFVLEAEKLFAVEDLVRGYALLDLSGTGTGALSMPVLAFEEEDSKFSFGGMHMDYELADYGKKQKTIGTIEALSFSSETLQVRTSPIALEGEGEMGDSIFGTGRFSASLASLNIIGEHTALVENLQLAADVRSPTSGMMDIDYKIALGKFSGSSMPYVLTDSVFDVTLKNLKESAIEKFSRLSVDADFSSPEAMEAHQQKMDVATSEFLSGSPELHLNNIAFKLDENTYMDLVGELKVDGTVAGSPGALNNPMMLIPAISANYTANLSEGLLNLAMQQYLSQQFAGAGMSPEETLAMMEGQAVQTAQMVQQFVDMGFLQKTEMGYRIETSFKDGEFKVNGNPMPLPF